MVFQDVPQNVNTNALTTCMTLSIIFVIARTLCRWWKLRAFEIEDFFNWLALAFYLAMSGLYIHVLPILYFSQAVVDGTATPTVDLTEQATDTLKCLFAIQMLFWLTLYAVKFSLLWMFRRLAVGLQVYSRIWICITAFTLLTLVGCIVSEATSCSSMTAYFTPGSCSTERDERAQAASLYYALAVDLLTDLLIMAFPIRLIWNLRINRMQKVAVGVVFSVGIITMICAIVRTSSLGVAANGGQIPMSWLVFWAAIEGLVAIVVNCLPAFAIFVRAQVERSRTGTYASAGAYAAQQSDSKSKSRRCGDNMLLSDMGPPEASGRGIAPRRSPEDSDTWTHAGSERNIRVGL